MGCRTAGVLTVAGGCCRGAGPRVEGDRWRREDSFPAEAGQGAAAPYRPPGGTAPGTGVPCGRWRRTRSFPAEAGKGSHRPPFEPPDATDEDCYRHFVASRAGTAPRSLRKMAGHLATSCSGSCPTDTGRQSTADTGVSAVCFWCGPKRYGRGRGLRGRPALTARLGVMRRRKGS